MQDKKKRIHAEKMWYAGLLLAVLALLAGCTKKEDLLFLSEEGVSEAGETEQTENLQPGEETSFAEVISDTSEPVSAEAQLVEKQSLICVHVCGAVLRPGVYEMKAGSRVYEAVQAAGGFAEGADQNYVNQAQRLGDGAKLVIPTTEEAAADDGTGDPKDTSAQIGIITETALTESGSGDQAAESGGRININTASEAQLCDIPGIGATRAAAIAAYRESHGGFQKPEDIMKVNGIKEGMYEKIKDSISVN